jgi:hypothetical protein
MPQARQASAQTLNLLVIQPRGGHQHLDIAALQTLVKGFGAKGGEERAEDADVLEGPQGSEIEFRDPAGKHRNRIALADLQLPQNVGKSIALLLQVAVGEIEGVAVSAQPAQGQVIGERASRVPVHSRMGHVHALAAGRAVELQAQGFPGKMRASLVVVQKMRRNFQRLDRFPDRRPVHGLSFSRGLA